MIPKIHKRSGPRRPAPDPRGGLSSWTSRGAKAGPLRARLVGPASTALADAAAIHTPSPQVGSGQGRPRRVGPPSPGAGGRPGRCVLPVVSDLKERGGGDSEPSPGEHLSGQGTARSRRSLSKGGPGGEVGHSRAGPDSFHLQASRSHPTVRAARARDQARGGGCRRSHHRRAHGAARRVRSPGRRRGGPRARSPKLDEVVAHLRSAEREIRAIPAFPLVPRVSEVKRQAARARSGCRRTRAPSRGRTWSLSSATTSICYRNSGRSSSPPQLIRAAWPEILDPSPLQTSLQAFGESLTRSGSSYGPDARTCKRTSESSDGTARSMSGQVTISTSSTTS